MYHVMLEYLDNEIIIALQSNTQVCDLISLLCLSLNNHVSINITYMKEGKYEE